MQFLSFAFYSGPLKLSRLGLDQHQAKFWVGYTTLKMIVVRFKHMHHTYLLNVQANHRWLCKQQNGAATGFDASVSAALGTVKLSLGTTMWGLYVTLSDHLTTCGARWSLLRKLGSMIRKCPCTQEHTRPRSVRVPSGVTISENMGRCGECCFCISTFSWNTWLQIK